MGYMKPDDERINRNARPFTWQDLPVDGRKGPAPELLFYASDETLEAWRRLWATPQAVMWDETDQALQRWARLYERTLDSDSDLVKLSTEMRNIEDRHGLNPRAMLQLRWRIVDDEGTILSHTDDKNLPDKRSNVIDLLKGNARTA